MRTKTLLLTAALVAAGTAASMAQGVYSLNIVGYVNVPIVSGFQMISCPLAASPNNTLASLFGNPPSGLPVNTSFEFWNGTGFTIDSVSVRGGWSAGGGETLNPGQGCFVNYPGSGVSTNFTFVGQVLSATSTGGNLSNPVVTGYQIISPQIPVAGDVVTTLQYSAHNGDQVLSWIVPNGPYSIDTLNTSRGGWTSGDPTNAPGISFFLNASAASAGNWVETNNFTGQ